MPAQYCPCGNNNTINNNIICIQRHKVRRYRGACKASPQELKYSAQDKATSNHTTIDVVVVVKLFHRFSDIRHLTLLLF